MKDYSFNYQKKKLQNSAKYKKKLFILFPFIINIILLINFLLIIWLGYQIWIFHNNGINQITVHGIHNLKQEDILNKLNINYAAPYHDLDPFFLNKKLSSLPWIWKINVRKRLPQSIDFFIEERKPWAYLQVKNQTLLLDKESFILPELNATLPLPTIINQKLQSFSKTIKLNYAFDLMSFLLNNSTLPLDQVMKIDITDSVMIKLFTYNGYVIKLNNNTFKQGIQNLTYAMSELKKILPVKILDLRYNNKIIIQK